MFKKILIANRGEISCRVAATCRRLGIRTVAVYSEADARAKHVASCDEAVLIGPAPAAQSYLNAQRIIDAALATGAQAVHPGYGFLSENASFAQACAQAGLVFIGPPASAIEAMGSKSAAKQLMERAGVPLVPGYHGDNQDAAHLQREATRIGYPVLIKASAGGGGKGMRIVGSEAEFAAALASCQREAQASFASAHVLIEKYLPRARHVEVQVFADTLGHCIHLFERDCSAQRRHQKVLEEAPAPGITAAQRQQIGQAAVAAAQAVGYVGAGTVEFIAESLQAGQLGNFYFMEMNTRLQVEHPVTEMITGLDLVEWQLRVAAGEPLPKAQDQLTLHGHALEARLYAENPRQQFLPSIGTLALFDTPPALHFRTAGLSAAEGAAANDAPKLRIDAGVREKDAIGTHYDPMIAKIITWGADRDAALAAMRQALSQVHVVGVKTNTEFLMRLIELPAFDRAQLHTGMIEQHIEVLIAPPPSPTSDIIAAACAAVLRDEHKRRSKSTVETPWDSTCAWRMNGEHHRTLGLRYEGDTLQGVARYGSTTLSDSAIQLDVGGWTYRCRPQAQDDARLIDHSPALGPLRAFVHRSSPLSSQAHVFAQGMHWVFDILDPLASTQVAHEGAGHLNAPMPGRIVAVLVQVGQTVTKGTPLVVLEAMKMEHTLNAPHDGVIEALPHAAGEQVGEGTALVVLAASD